MHALLAFSLIELAVGLALLILIIALLVAVLTRGGNKVTGIAVDRLVKMECASASGNGGEMDVDIGQLSQSVLDILTQGFTLEMVSAKIKWRKTSRGCVYTIEARLNDGEDTVTRESAEMTVASCP